MSKAAAQIAAYRQKPDLVSSPLEKYLQPAQLSSHKPTSGGAYRDRTDDPLLAKQVLSQLS